MTLPINIPASSSLAGSRKNLLKEMSCTTFIFVKSWQCLYIQIFFGNNSDIQLAIDKGSALFLATGLLSL